MTKPKTSTRRGNGAGWGGPAKGAGTGSRPAFDGTRPGPGRGNTSPEGDARRARAAAVADEMREIVADLARDETQPGMVRGYAANSIIDRHDGKAIARTVNEHTGKNGGPIEIGSARERIAGRIAGLIGASAARDDSGGSD